MKTEYKIIAHTPQGLFESAWMDKHTEEEILQLVSPGSGPLSEGTKVRINLPRKRTPARNYHGQFFLPDHVRRRSVFEVLVREVEDE